MTPTKKILCPIDFSDPSCEALRMAADLAKRFSAELVALYVVVPPVVMVTAGTLHDFDPVDYEEKEAARAEVKLKTTTTQCVSPEIPVRMEIVRGDPAHEIVRYSTEEKVEMIVIATHGLGGWRKMIFGSVTEKVLKLASCPVFVVHEPHKEH